MQKSFLPSSFYSNTTKSAWILGLNTVRTMYNKTYTCLDFKTLYRCIVCGQFKGQGLQLPMADLPDMRFPQVQFPVVFTNVGVKLFGPFTLIQQNKEEKPFICLFSCLVTRAVHLEVIEDLTTTTDMTANRVFFVRLGQPRFYFSGNGSNFLGARKVIQRQPLNPDHEFIRQ